MNNPDATLTAFVIAFALSGLLVVGLAIPMMRRKVKPNWLYGFRTRKTLSEEGVWYAANAYAGRWLLGTGIAWTLGAIVLRLIPGVGDNLDAYALAFTVVMLLTVGAMVWASLRYARGL